MLGFDPEEKGEAAACISPADINAEETLNTLKYANRARNIQNKPVVNRDPLSNEMLKMRQQLEFLQAELCARGGGASSDEIQSYASILYLRIPSSFRIILRGKDVEHHNVVNDMMMAREITYRPQPG